ncbi:hypothetical protein LZ016_10410 [Sphingomonas sp. SM33]|uniref:DUF4239 domain-containing protein n=1 Tax=Sphingomonas telluris TaxID=2907998 RepID=A0ABS9VNF7_9SPHN|nr:hypothetical protein [Sphingomonas telluris]MCH8616511.1 hypothetical protein [Sphingomonas telluris]
MILIDLLPAWLIGILTLLVLAGATFVGERLKARYPAPSDEDTATQEGYIISGVVGLLALLLGFTFSLAVDRFETRRVLVVEEANAIHTAYLRAQTFGEPHRATLDGLLLRYLDVRIRLGGVTRHEDVPQLLAETHRLQRQLWDATLAAIANQRDDISSAAMDSMNQVIETASTRRSAREAHVPRRVFVVVFFYMVGTAISLGYVMGPRRRRAIGVLLVLTVISYAVIFDIDDAGGGIRESQSPMLELKADLSATNS